MGYLPIFLQVAGSRCMVVGAGEVAARKAQSLLDAGAEVTVVSPALGASMEDGARAGRIRHISRAYETGDMRGYALVFAATDDAVLHKNLFDEARALSIPINVADEPEFCTFIMPAVTVRGALKIAVSTGGASPAMAKRIAARIDRVFGPEYAVTLEILRAARLHLKTTQASVARRSRLLSALAASRLPAYLRRGDLESADRVLRRTVGTGLEELGVSTERLHSGETPAAR